MNTPTAVTHGLMSARCVTTWRSVWKNDAFDGIASPKNGLICDTAMRIAAPVEKPMITVCEMKLTSPPSRATPIASCSTPVSSVTVSTSEM